MHNAYILNSHYNSNFYLVNIFFEILYRFMATSYGPRTTSSKSRRTVHNILENELKMQKRNKKGKIQNGRIHMGAEYSHNPILR